MDTQGLAQYANYVYKATAGLMKLVPEGRLGWRPADKNNWMTLGQLLCHLSDSTGEPMKGFITGQWPPMSPEDMLPPAEKMPTISSVGEALDRLEKDRRLTEQLLRDLSEEDFKNRMTTAPWSPTPMPLWVWLLNMIEHQIVHKVTLFTYLKMLGVPVNTAHMYGMA